MGIEIVDVADVQRMRKESYECAATRGNVKDCEYFDKVGKRLE
jgi:hypothetical protein